jgi:hypothetical protein
MAGLAGGAQMVISVTENAVSQAQLDQDRGLQRANSCMGPVRHECLTVKSEKLCIDFSINRLFNGEMAQWWQLAEFLHRGRS